MVDASGSLWDFLAGTFDSGCLDSWCFSFCSNASEAVVAGTDTNMVLIFWA